MRAFHVTWVAFFLCFFGWFGIAPLMPVIRDELRLTKEQIGNTIIASVAITIIARLLIGWLCDRIGPRRTYAALLTLGSIPVMAIGLADTYAGFLIARLCIGAIGASFVVTQHHMSLMFAPNVVGTANATTAGWGNLGGGVTQIVMPLLLAAILSFGIEPALGWRLAMVVPGAALFVCGILYYRLTQDAPEGDLRELRARGDLPPAEKKLGETFVEAAKDPRVWALFAIYGACFGVELTIDNIAALYFHDSFELDLATAGIVASLFGMMNLFARALGGIAGDRAGIRWGLRGRVAFLGIILLLEGLSLLLFAEMRSLGLAIAALLLFGLFVNMCTGATYAVVPSINRRALGSVSGIVGAGGNVGAVAAGFLFRSESLSTSTAFSYLGLVVVGTSALALLVRFSPQQEAAAKEHVESSLAAHRALGASPQPAE